MKKTIVLLMAATLFAGCDGERRKEAQSQYSQAKAEDGHDHDHGHSHDHDHGEHLDLGTTTTAGVTYQAFQLGMGEETEQAVEIVLGKESAKPAALRAWVGSESAEGSVKSLAEGNGPAYEMHLELPQPALAGSALWVEVESAAGERAAARFELKK